VKQMESSTAVPTGHASPHVGKVVEYADPVGKVHQAILTAAWGPELGECAVNLVYVSDDVAERDPYGRQIKRETSVAPEGPHTAHGRFYRVR
jgi:hypothetical protein